MSRFSLLLCFTLIFGVTARPNKPWNKPPHEVLQDTVMSKGLKAEPPSGVEVEPPEDMQEIDHNFGLDGKIWSVKGPGKPPQRAQEVLEGLNDPSVSNLLKVQIQNLGKLPVADAQVESFQEVADRKYHQKPEEDTDDIDHPAFGEVQSPEQDMDDVYHGAREELQRYLAPLMADKAEAQVRVAPSGPEWDEDELYHGDDPPSYMQGSLALRVRGGNVARVHLQPEEDMDDLYHRDVLHPIPDQGDAKLGLGRPVDVPSQRRHSEPEEDLDHIFHP